MKYKDPKQTIHSVCGDAVEMSLKASVASRTLDNITTVLVCFKNFKKALKKTLAGQDQQLDKGTAFRPSHINRTLSLPNIDLTEADIERPL